MIVSRIKQILLKEYGLSATHMHRLSGYYDVNYSFIARNKKYFLKIYGRDKLPQIQFQIAFIHACYRAGVPVAEIVKTNRGKAYVKVEKTYGKVQKFLEGKKMFHVPYSTRLLFHVGKQLGALHAATRGIKFKTKAWKKYEWDLAQFDLIIRDYPRAKRYLSHQVEELIESVMNDWNVNKGELITLRKGFIHCDFHEYNLLVRGNRCVGIVDFGDANYSWYVADVAIALAHLCMRKRNRVALSVAFLRGYLSVFSLTQTERRWLPLLIRVRMAMILVGIARDFHGQPRSIYREFFRGMIDALRYLDDRNHQKSLQDIFGMVR